jgi:hypothetical protein
MISLASNASKASKTLVAYPTSISKVNVKPIHVLKASNNSQYLHD